MTAAVAAAGGWLAISATSGRDATTATAPRTVRLATLSVSANRIMRAGKPFHFFGVNRDSLEWGASNWGGCGGDGHFGDKDFDEIRAWGASAIRLPLSQAGWLGRSCDAQAYASAVDSAVAKANARGMYAIIDLHWSDADGHAPCDATCLTGQQLMPDADSVRFWEQVARRYAHDPGVIFDLFNEPHDVSWSCWRDGGCEVPGVTVQAAPGAPTGTPKLAPSYRAVGMQRLYDTIRAQGAGNLVLVAGLDWAYDLSGVTRGFALQGTDIAYDTHVYTAFHHTTQDWDAHFGRVAAHVPVTSTEFGAADCSTADTAPLLRYFEDPAGDQQARMSWTVWSWNNPGSCTQPSVLANWDGAPLAGQGALIHAALATASP